MRESHFGQDKDWSCVFHLIVDGIRGNDFIFSLVTQCAIDSDPGEEETNFLKKLSFSHI